MPDNAEFVVIKGSGTRTVKGNVTVMPAEPKAGYEWDTSRLESDGIITIKPSATGINGVNTETNAGAAVYDLQGRKINKASNGVFIVNKKKKIIINK